jgi:SWI/SNF-related matrix-associated actin-dependent regulator 1 of chromatin subfamily A
MLRRRRTEVLPDLPTKTHIDISAPIDDVTRALADEVIAKLREKGIDIAAALENSKLPVIFELISKVRGALATAKIPAMLEAIEEIEATGEPQLVFCAHRAPIDLLEGRPGWAVITGDVSPDKRSAIVHEFQSGRLRGVGITIKAGGVGLTLTRAHQALFVDLEWTPALNCQAEDRIVRIGQDRGCIIRRLIAAHELEERVAEKLLEKQLLIDGSVERAAVSEGGSTIANDAAARQLESLLAGAVVGSASADGLRRQHPAAVAPVPDADSCPF